MIWWISIEIKARNDISSIVTGKRWSWNTHLWIRIMSTFRFINKRWFFKWRYRFSLRYFRKNKQFIRKSVYQKRRKDWNNSTTQNVTSIQTKYKYFNYTFKLLFLNNYYLLLLYTLFFIRFSTLPLAQYV